MWLAGTVQVHSKLLKPWAGVENSKKSKPSPLYLLSAENLGRDAEELEELLEIIGDVVDEIAAPGHDWHIHLMGHMDLLPKWLVARLKAAEVRTSHRDGLTINVAIGYGGRQEIVDAVQALLDDKIAEGATQAELRDAVTIPRHWGTPIHLWPAGSRFSDSNQW